MTNTSLLLASGLLLIAYLLDMLGRRFRLPNVVLLIVTGLVVRHVLDRIGFKLGYMDEIVPILGTLGLILIVLELIRGRRLKERYALLWLVTGIVLLVLSAWRGGLNTIAGWLGVSGYPPAILFAAAIMFVIAVLLHYSTVLSKLTDDNVLLAQEVALLRTRLDALESAAKSDVSPTTAERPGG